MSASAEAFGEEPPAPPPPGGGAVARNTAIFSLATGISRVVGLVREIATASFFGTSGRFSAFTLAFQIPNLVSNLFANAALSAAFVPVFTDLLQQGRRKEAFRLASTLFWVILIALGAVTAFFILAAGVIMPLFTGSTFTAALDHLTVVGWTEERLAQALLDVPMLHGPTLTENEIEAHLAMKLSRGPVCASLPKIIVKVDTSSLFFPEAQPTGQIVVNKVGPVYGVDRKRPLNGATIVRACQNPDFVGLRDLADPVPAHTRF